jgi:NAD(P)-dependent dehydrogenase (short-subunit alcohol dehydrogenase family)
MTDHAELIARLRDFHNLVMDDAADALAALVAERDGLREVRDDVLFWRDAAEAERDALRAMLDEARRVLQQTSEHLASLTNVVVNSKGIVGYPLRGDITPWDEGLFICIKDRGALNNRIGSLLAKLERKGGKDA